MPSYKTETVEPITRQRTLLSIWLDDVDTYVVCVEYVPENEDVYKQSMAELSIQELQILHQWIEKELTRKGVLDGLPNT